MKKFITPLLTLLTASIMLSGCVKEKVGDPVETISETTIALRVPIASQPSATRSIGENSQQDNKIDEIDVLLFDGSDNYVAHYFATNIVTDSNDPRLKSVKVRLPVGTYRAVILANSHDMVISHVVSGNPKRAALLKEYTKTLDYGTKYASDGLAANYKGFPMWGDLGNITITATGGETFSGKLYRMMSKINLEVAYTETSGVKNFDLQSIDIYNYNKTGYLAAEDGNWLELPAKKVATEYPSREGAVAIPTSLHYNVSYITDDATNKIFVCRDEMFIFESAAFNGAWSWEKNTCVVIGGEYMGQKGYYRLDFSQDGTTILDQLRNHSYTIKVKEIKTFGFGTPQEAVKNKSENLDYEVIPWDDSEIGEIIVDGPIQLIVSPSSKLTFDKLAGLQKVEIYTNYKGGWQIDKLPGDATKYRIVDENGQFVDWLTIDHGGTIVAEKKELQISVAENTTNLVRKAYIYLTCSKIKHRLEVTQTDKVGVMLEIEFYDTASSQWVSTRSQQFIQDVATNFAESVQLRVTWQPADHSIHLSMNGVGGAIPQISWEGNDKPDGKGTEITSPTGQEIFTLQPAKMSGYVKGSFVEHMQTVTYSMSVAGTLYAETITLQHFVKDVVIENPKMYLMDGKPQYVTVKSNTPWELYANKNISSGIGTSNAKVVESVGDVVSLQVMNDAANAKTEKVSEGAYNLPNGTRITIKTIDDIFSVSKPTIYTGHLGLYAESTESVAVNDAKSVLCASGIPQDGREANSYVLNPESGMGIFIPVRAANGKMTDKYKTTGSNNLYNGGVPITTQIVGATATYGARLVWADEAGSNGKGLEEDAMLSLVAPSGIGENGYIFVLPGNVEKEGNAVVAVTRNADGTGEILWSWHIWVTKGLKFESEKNMQTRIMPGHNGNGPLTQYWLDRNLGALNNGGVGKTDIYTYGLHYQWGRKDPFPGANKVDVIAYSVENERQLYYANGEIQKTGDHGSVNYQVAGATVPLSIQNPLTFYYNNVGTGDNRSNWLGIAIHTLWGVAHESTGAGDTEAGTDLGKSIFDPCPAGYRVPRREAKSWNDATNTHHWGREFGSMDVAMGSPTANIEVNYGMQWPVSTPYKGGWFPTAGNRNTGGLHAYVGNIGDYWCGSSVSVFYARNLRVSKNSVVPSISFNLHSAHALRCVAQ